MDPFKNNNGFTFLSIVLSVSILIVLLPFLVYLIQSITFTSKYDELSTLSFFHHIHEEAMLSTKYTIEENKIQFYLHSGEKATISQYKNLIRRQVHGEGHEVYLRNIKSMKVKSISNGFKITIITNKGEKYEKTFAFYE